MKFTIIPSDNRVIIDGIGYTVQQIKIDPMIHAVQWYDSFGEIEYSVTFDGQAMTKRPNETIHDHAQFDKILMEWEKSHQQFLIDSLPSVDKATTSTVLATP